jgi:phosphorylcholine metabolism protein LicD
MIDLKLFKEFLKLLEDNKIEYWIFGGMALDGLRGKLSRPHEDIDIYIYYRDSKKLLDLASKKYECYKKGNMYLIKKDGLKIDIILLAKNESNYISYGNRAIAYYPKELFQDTIRVKIQDTNFRIAPIEVLVFESKYSKDKFDKKFGLTVVYEHKWMKKIWYKPIKTYVKLERL